MEPFLTLHPYHLSRDKAREAVIGLVGRLGDRPKAVDWKSSVLTVTVGSKSKQFLYAEMEREVRQTGVVEKLQRLLDRADDVFGGTFGDIGTPNSNLKIKTEFAGWQKEVQGPCRVGRAEFDLMEDILHYRQEVCRASADHTFREMARHYRVYLAASISIVDAFINRHILLAQHDGFESEAFSQLKEARGMEEKVDCWLQTCTEKSFTELARRKEWCHFQELRQERNALHHAVEPFSVYSVKDISRRLNYTQTGVGGLLHLLRRWHNKPAVLFIERLRTAPEVVYRAVRLSSKQ